MDFASSILFVVYIIKKTEVNTEIVEPLIENLYK